MISCSVVNKDLTLKAKAKDLTSRTTSTGFLQTYTFTHA